jgi:tetratricopeptide (TPR) repeat protein
MELTIEQALQQGITAHQEGKLQDAERLYRAILQSQSAQPDANHNMGVLAVDVGKVQEALPFFKTALEANSSISQYWLSYIAALIKLGQIADAKNVFSQAKSKGASGEKFDQLGTEISKLSTNPHDPPSGLLQPIINLYMEGQLQQALSESTQMLERFPNSVFLYNIAGASNEGLMQFDAAVDRYKQALKIKPDYAEAYYNMGNALNAKGDLDAAIDSYKQALKIKPDHASALRNMGNVLNNKGDLDAAIDIYKQALEIKPDYAEAYYNMGNALRDKGDLDAAIDSYKQALKIKPDYAEAHNNICNLLQNGNVNTQKMFQTIYKNRLWGSGSDLYFSGSGSHNEEIVSVYTKAIEKWCASFSGTFDAVDLGCGDFAVGSKIRHLFNGYIGCDIVQELVSYNSQKFQSSDVQFLCLDLSKDTLPKGDVVFVRQVFQHLSNDLIMATLPKLVESYTYLILTEHLPKATNFKANLDKETGIYTRGGLQSGIVLTEPPFNLNVLDEIQLCEFPESGGIIKTTAYQLSKRP